MSSNHILYLFTTVHNKCNHKLLQEGGLGEGLQNQT